MKALSRANTKWKAGGLACAAVIGTTAALFAVQSVPEARPSEQAVRGSRQCDRRKQQCGERISVLVRGVRFSLAVPKPWEPHAGGTPHPDRSGSNALFVSRSVFGPQDAEAIVFWTSFPEGDGTQRCGDVLPRSVGPSAAHLAAAVARAPGTSLVKGPVDTTIGGRPAKHVVLGIRKDSGCDPGYFYIWPPGGPLGKCWGACWLKTSVGDRVSVWIVPVEGRRLFIEAETSARGGRLADPEITEIVRSIRFQP